MTRGALDGNPFAAPSAVFVMGPTASGKSAFAVELAREIGGAVISVDSMQIYRGLDIGTAKESASVRAEVPHEMIDVADPDEEYSVARFRDEATEAGKKAQENGLIPIFAGGTGLYFESLFYPLSFGGTDKDAKLRGELEAEAERDGAHVLHARLATLDPASAARLHPNDTKRVIRALEVALLSENKVSDAEKRVEPDVIAVKFEPSDRKKLYERINARVDEMFAAGLVDEIAALRPSREWQSMQAIGYKEFMPYLSEGRFPPAPDALRDIAELIKKHTRNYAKRQLTWFRRYAFAKSFDTCDFEGAASYIRSRIRPTAEDEKI